MSIEILEVSLWVRTFEFRECWLEVWKLMDVIPIAWGRCAMELEYFEDLIDLRVTVKHWLFFDKLSKNATNSPNINTKAILFLPKKDLWSSVP